MTSSKKSLRQTILLASLIALLVVGFRLGLFDRLFAEPLDWPTQWEQVVQRAAKEPRPILLFFESAGCPPCRWMRYQVWTDTSVKEAVTQTVWPVSLDLRDANAVELARRYGVTHTPTTMIVNQRGVPIYDLQGQPILVAGFQSVEQILALLKRVPNQIEQPSKVPASIQLID